MIGIGVCDAIYRPSYSQEQTDGHREIKVLDTKGNNKIMILLKKKLKHKNKNTFEKSLVRRAVQQASGSGSGGVSLLRSVRMGRSVAVLLLLFGFAGPGRREGFVASEGAVAAQSSRTTVAEKPAQRKTNSK